VNESRFVLRTLTGYSTFSAFADAGVQNISFWPFIHTRLVWLSNDHYDGYASPDGISWFKVYDNANLGSMGAAPSYIGFNASSWGASQALVTSFTYCRFSF
jgi:hypothetical protein